MKIYVLTTYEYDTYSYSGITESDHHYFSSNELAEREAKKLGLKVVRYAETSDEATIEEEEVIMDG